MTEPAGQQRRGRKPLPPGMAKVKRNLRFGRIFDDLERELEPGESMTHLLEVLMSKELLRRRRAKKRTGNEGAPPA